MLSSLAVLGVTLPSMQKSMSAPALGIASVGAEDDQLPVLLWSWKSWQQVARKHQVWQREAVSYRLKNRGKQAGK
jgi:hypothetical protein